LDILICGGRKMLRKTKLTVANVTTALQNPNARLALIFGTLIVAALMGAAPHNFGG
jgi:hypothetical protein